MRRRSARSDTSNHGRRHVDALRDKIDAARPAEDEKRIERRDGHLERRAAQAQVAHRLSQQRTQRQRQDDQDEQRDKQQEEDKKSEKAGHAPILGASDDRCRNPSDEGDDDAGGAKLCRAGSEFPARARASPGRGYCASHFAPDKDPRLPSGKVPRAMLERELGIRRDDPDADNQIYDDAKEHLFEHRSSRRYAKRPRCVVHSGS